VLNENVSRGINCFYSMIGESDEDEDFHGFTEKEIQFANLKSEYLQAQTEQHRAAFWAAKGIALDPEDREEIFRNSGASTYQRKPLRLSNGGSSHKKKTTQIKTYKEPTYQNQNALSPKSVLKRDSKGKSITPKNKPRASMTHEEISEMHFEENLQKPKSEIQLPGWRRIESPYKSQNGVDISNDEEMEDMSDKVFVSRHAKAEEEEQQLWEKWQAKRLEDGKAITGRSKSSGWREADLDLNTPRLRSQRVSSVKSECSTPGRLSPATVERVTEICVLPSTPPFIMKSLHKAFDKKGLPNRVLKGPSLTPKTANDKMTLFKTSVHRSPRTRIQEKFRNSLGDSVTEMVEEEIIMKFKNNDTEQSLLEKSKDIELSNSKEKGNVIKGELPIVRRSQSDTIGMRRSNPREELGSDPSILKNSKENIACQLMNIAMGSTKELPNARHSVNRLSDSSCRSDSADAMNRVLKDSNVAKVIHVHPTSRQATKKTILSQKSVHRNSYTYPLRSQTMSRRTRQGVKR